MKVTTNVAALARAAALASDAIEQKEAKRFRALGAAQVRTTEDGATLTLNNLHFQITHSFAADIEASGKIAICAEPLAKLMEALPKDAEITIELRDDVAHIKSGRRSFKLATIPASEWPQDLQLGAETGTTTLPRADAHALFSRTSFAVATPGDARGYLRGCFLHSVDDNKLVACATDGYMLSRYSVTAGSILSQDRHLIVPTAAVEMIEHILADKSLDDVVLRCSRTLFVIEGTGVKFVTRLVDGVYPQYEAVIAVPTEGVTVERAALRSALARSRAVSGARELQLSWADNELHLTVSDASDDVIDATVAHPGSIAVNASRLSDVIEELHSSRLTLSASGAREPLRITTEDANFLAILAPRYTSGGDA
jgi:DNA polymerase-3 subunit beta